MNAALLEMFFGLPLPAQRAWLQTLLPGICDMTAPEREVRLREFLAGIDLRPYRADIADSLIREVRLWDAVPEAYAEFRPLVRDGVQFLLQRFPPERLREICLHQILLPAEAGSWERLLRLAGDIPTLFKLGQVIARKPGLDPDLKRWLVRLENDRQGTSVDWMRERIRAETAGGGPVQVVPDDRVLAEGSVGAVMVVQWRPEAGAEPRPGVAKILRPRIAEDLPGELFLLAEMGPFFESRRHLYEMQDFSFLETFRDVRKALERETDLRSEQKNLALARQQYGGVDGPLVPEVLPFSTPGLTAMEFLPGPKVTESGLGAGQREELAGELFRSLVLQPLFRAGERSIFHGDPHAGNILLMKREGERPRPVLLDWSQAGFLSPAYRRAFVQLALGVRMEDPSRIIRACAELMEGEPRPGVECATLVRRIHADMRAEGAGGGHLFARALDLLDRLTRGGIKFPSDLLLLRKAVFTLDGVLSDLAPGFSAEAETERFFAALVREELPHRGMALAFPWLDRPSRYPTMVSNLDAQALLLDTLLGGLRRWWRWQDDLWGRPCAALTTWLGAGRPSQVPA